MVIHINKSTIDVLYLLLKALIPPETHRKSNKSNNDYTDNTRDLFYSFSIKFTLASSYCSEAAAVGVVDGNESLAGLCDSCL